LYEGKWKDGEKHGHGIQYNSDGKIKYEGEWFNGSIIPSTVSTFKEYPERKDKKAKERNKEEAKIWPRNQPLNDEEIKTFLGRKDFDNRMITFFADEINKEYGIDLHEDKVALQRLRDAAKKAKSELSYSSETEVNIPFITADASGPIHFNLKITRAKFESLVDDLISKEVPSYDQSSNDSKKLKINKKSFYCIDGNYFDEGEKIPEEKSSGKGYYMVEGHTYYEGEFKNGKFNGQGIRFGKGQQIEGEFKDGEPIGKVKIWDIWHTKLEYEGGFRDGNKNGQGKLYYRGWQEPGKLQVYYEGEFRDGVKWNGQFYDNDGEISKHKIVNGMDVGPAFDKTAGEKVGKAIGTLLFGWMFWMKK